METRSVLYALQLSLAVKAVRIRLIAFHAFQLPTIRTKLELQQIVLYALVQWPTARTALTKRTAPLAFRRLLIC